MGALLDTLYFCHYKCHFGDNFSSIFQKVMIFGKLSLFPSPKLKQVLPKVIWDELRRHSHGREWIHPLCVLAVQCPLYTSPITQPWVRYIHTTVQHSSYTLHCAVLSSKKHLPLPVEGSSPYARVLLC